MVDIKQRQLPFNIPVVSEYFNDIVSEEICYVVAIYTAIYIVHLLNVPTYIKRKTPGVSTKYSIDHIKLAKVTFGFTLVVVLIMMFYNN